MPMIAPFVCVSLIRIQISQHWNVTHNIISIVNVLSNGLKKVRILVHIVESLSPTLKKSEQWWKVVNGSSLDLINPRARSHSRTENNQIKMRVEAFLKKMKVKFLSKTTQKVEKTKKKLKRKARKSDFCIKLGDYIPK
mgnify:CR=1 FL=1